MENREIPTAEEFLKDKFREIYYARVEAFTNKITESKYLELHVTGRIDGNCQNYPEMILEFARLHVKAVLEAAAERASLKVREDYLELHQNDNWM